MSDLLELAARVETATGVDRELVALIRCAMFAPSGSFVKQSPINGAWCVYQALRPDGKERLWESRNLTPEQRLGDFMESLDAAMSLVPEGWRTAMVSEMEHRDGWHWRLGWKQDAAPRFACPGADGVGATAAHALTAASLRAFADIKSLRE